MRWMEKKTGKQLNSNEILLFIITMSKKPQNLKLNSTPFAHSLPSFSFIHNPTWKQQCVTSFSYAPRKNIFNHVFKVFFSLFKQEQSPQIRQSKLLIFMSTHINTNNE